MGKVTFVGWNMAKQFALDDADNIWHVASWFDHDGDEITVDTEHWAGWDLVAYVTVYCDQMGADRVWSALFPDDFGRVSEG